MVVEFQHCGRATNNSLFTIQLDYGNVPLASLVQILFDEDVIRVAMFDRTWVSPETVFGWLQTLETVKRIVRITRPGSEPVG